MEGVLGNILSDYCGLTLNVYISAKNGLKTLGFKIAVL